MSFAPSRASGGCHKASKQVKKRQKCEIWLENERFGYNKLALRGTLAWVLGKDMRCGSEGKKEFD